jgi:hypothetical protein
MPRLEPLVTYRAEVKEGVEIGAGPAGSRRIFDITGGSFEGPKLSGTVLPSGADWLLVGTDGVGRLDVRATFETDDGAHVYVQYHGVVSFNEEMMTALAAGRETGFGDTYFMTAVRFETGDPRYAWLNAIVAVGEGRMLPNAVEYRVFQLTND